MLSEIPDFSNVRILVAGDVMLDRYWHGDASRISPEAPVPVVRVENEEYRAGGAGNVALNISALGGCAALFGVVGKDEAAAELERIFAENRVERHISALAECTTITKLRVVSRHQHLVRIDFEDGFPAYPEGGRQGEFESLLGDCDLLILSDYAKGTLRDICGYIDIARRLGKPVLADPKGTDFDRYRGATLLTPNLGEFEAVVGRCASEAEVVARAMGLLEGGEA